MPADEGQALQTPGRLVLPTDEGGALDHTPFTSSNVSNIGVYGLTTGPTTAATGFSVLR